MTEPGGSPPPSDRRAEDRSVIDTFFDTLSDTSHVDEYERRSLDYAWHTYYNEGPVPLAPSIRVELKSLKYLDAMNAGTVAHAVQEAAAILGAHLNRRPEVHRVLGGDVDRVRLVQVAQRGNVVWLRLGEPAERELPIPGPRPAERAVRELLSYLPRDLADSGAIEGALGALQPVRRAVNTIAEMSLSNHSEVDLQFIDETGEATESILTEDTASYLHRSLDVGQEIVESERRRVRVDGMRNSRRVCYLILPGNREIAVSIDDRQRILVQSLIGRMALADLTSRRIENPAGRRSHKAYRLVSLADDDAQLPT